MTFDIGPTGIWLCDTPEPHSFDEPLARSLVNFFIDNDAGSILDVGCGDGRYVDYLVQRVDAYIEGVDGNPNTPKFDARCHEVDVSKPFKTNKCDWVLSLEVGEHIPQQYEDRFLDNLMAHCRDGVVLSWFPREGHGIGHVNPRSNEWVRVQMSKRDFIMDEKAGEQLREAASLWWFKESLQVYRL